MSSKVQTGESSKTTRSHTASLLSWFVWCSFAFAILGGYGLAAHLSHVLAFGFDLGPSIISLIQAHGRLQLFGWVGLLLMGISLFMLPRLVSRPIRNRKAPVAILTFFSIGVLVRSAAQILLPYLSGHPAAFHVGWALSAGGVFEAVGIFVYLFVTIDTVGQQRTNLLRKPALRRLLPYIVTMLSGWFITALFCILLSFQAAGSKLAAADVLVNGFATDVFLYLVLLPATFLFSVKLLPMFLGLRQPDWPVGTIGATYGLAALGVIGTAATPLLGTALPLGIPVTVQVALGIIIVLFVWHIEVPLRRTVPERLQGMLQEGTLRGRGLIPDKGEYGKFEWHVHAAFTWLAVSAALQAVSGAFSLVYGSPLVAESILRHMYLLGFVANLIFGVGVRMLPGLLGTKLWKPILVGITAVLLNVAALARVVPPAIPLDLLPATAVRFLFGLSGSIALIAVIIFAVNLGLGILQGPLRTKGARSSENPAEGQK